MRLHHRAACLLFLAAPAAAQFVGPGLTWTGTTGGYAGSFLPSCANLPVAALLGDTVTIRVWGDPGSPYVLATANSASQCLPLPGIGNALVLDLPAFPVIGGLLTQTTPCLSCPPGLEPLTFVVPPSLPVGLSVSFQAAAFGGSTFALTVAITATMQ